MKKDPRGNPQQGAKPPGQPQKPRAASSGGGSNTPMVTARYSKASSGGGKASVELGEPEYPEPVRRSSGGSMRAHQANTCGCGELAAPDAVGPMLRFAGYDPDRDLWTGTVMFVCKPGVTLAPVLTWTDTSTGQTYEEEARCVDSWVDWNFWRFELEVPVATTEKRVAYQVSGSAAGESAFYVAGRHQSYHWGYYSCNGFSPDTPRGDVDNKWKGLDPLWRDVMARHAAHPLHVMVGGGDQLYNDDVMRTPVLQPFLEAPEEARPAWEWSEDMAFGVEEYYFHHYAVHFSRGVIGEAMRNIPYAMTWDDHDIFDGWGSYPEHLQLCDVFQGIFRAARRFYLLFQLHTTPTLARHHDIFGRKSYNQVLLLGTRVALALPDCRASRTENQVLSLDTHMSLIVRTDELPDSVTHLVVGTTVPVVYPHLLGGEAVLGCFAKMNKVPCIHRLFKRTGFDRMVFNEVEEPELLDDLRDHWSTPAHRDERRFLIEHLQMLAKIKNLRVSFISGDVHLATTGRLYSYPKPADLGRDFRFMPQIVSSAIANAPPPDGLVSALHLLGRAGFTNKVTRNKMCKLFDADGKHRLLNRRNWCEVWELDQNADSHISPVQPGQPSLPGALVFSLRVETFDPKLGQDADSAAIREYQTVAPVLEKPVASAAARHGRHGIAHTKDVYGTRYGQWKDRYKPAKAAAPPRRARSIRLVSVTQGNGAGAGGGAARERALRLQGAPGSGEPESPHAVDEPEQSRFFDS